MSFNPNFYQPNRTATVEQAVLVLESKGIKNATFKGMSISHGASFYFDFNGREIRVSDHRKTSYYDGIQIDLYPVKLLSINKNKN